MKREQRLKKEKHMRYKIWEEEKRKMMEKEQMEIDKKREYDEKLRAEFEKDKANLANKTDRVSLKIEAERKEQ